MAGSHAVGRPLVQRKGSSVRKRGSIYHALMPFHFLTQFIPHVPHLLEGNLLKSRNLSKYLSIMSQPEILGFGIHKTGIGRGHKVVAFVPSGRERFSAIDHDVSSGVVQTRSAVVVEIAPQLRVTLGVRRAGDVDILKSGPLKRLPAEHRFPYGVAAFGFLDGDFAINKNIVEKNL